MNVWRKLVVFFVLGLASVVALSTVAPAADKKGPAKKNAAVEPTEDFINPNAIQENDFRYNPAGRRDPFLPFDLVPKVKREGPLSPLEQYSLGQLRVTAIVKDARDENKAIVENAAGQGFPVRVGMRIGDLGGVVVKILDDRIQVLESTTDIVTGQAREEIRELKIQGNEQNKQ